jgi:hypothetical protein
MTIFVLLKAALYLAGLAAAAYISTTYKKKGKMGGALASGGVFLCILTGFLVLISKSLSYW